ncbi:hypothetical protein R6Q59_032847 [Mikania micrantha]|uniref:HTH three-helical bundle domain-containing protein n=1 Tax=Mikania micrantha TaxID=192012 RepID=A0A5N6NSI1_9ASTR|nr:hypothetical protein E3N88_17470 [Mikania micrantha]KAD5317548.1 hypothetical protein E3N88_17494 [Mikania micrantha]
MKSLYPNSTEHIVASALLLLSSSPSIDEITGNCNVDRCESLLLNKSFSRSSASSTVSNDEISSDEAHGRRLRMVANAIAHSEHEMKLKVVRKSRSKTLRISDCRRISGAEQKFVAASCSSSLTTDGSSCLSVGSSSSESCKPKMKRDKSAQDAKKKPSSAVSSAHLLRRSEAILKVLAHNGCASEVRIRQLLGDSPDTSKALRMLLKKEEVRRSGAGGRTDPFIYQISAK